MPLQAELAQLDGLPRFSGLVRRKDHALEVMDDYNLWVPKVHGLRRGFLKEELDYFTRCIERGEKPTVITPEESKLVVHAMKTAETSVRENRVLSF